MPSQRDQDVPRVRTAVSEAARRVLDDVESDHAAAELLRAVAERLCEDIDQAGEVRDRVIATRGLIEVLDAMNGAPKPPAALGAGAGEGGGSSGDNPFGIPEVPPGVGDSAAG